MSDEENDCPLCLLPLEPYDDAHPLQCPSRHCHFNCCMGCLERMIQSTKDEAIEASDGNTFRVFLHCPNCRSNLGPSIRDTVLLRKVDKYSHPTNGGAEVADEKLSASELRFQYALKKDECVTSAIEAAQKREDEFFGRGVEKEEDRPLDFLDLGLGRENSHQGSFGKESVWSFDFDDEEGVEADLHGPHKSFIFRHHSVEDLGKVEDKPSDLADVPADATLLCGLEAFMTEQEQQFTTAQMISGDTERLAAATEMMHYISALSRQGMKPSLKRRQSSMSLGGRRGQLTKKSSMLESVRQIIKEGNEAQRMEEEKEARKAVGAVAMQLNGGGLAGGRRNMKRMVEMEMKQQMRYMKLHPLPLRMPKYAEVTSSKAESRRLAFVDDTWDGTVMDAFSKITVTRSLLGKVTVTKQHGESSGIRRVIDAGSPTSPRSDGKGYIDTVRPRVLVASINRELGQQGVVKGDVVTHFNGEPFDGTASELMGFIDGRYEGEVLTFVFNADSAVAEALRRRSMILDD